MKKSILIIIFVLCLSIGKVNFLSFSVCQLAFAQQESSSELDSKLDTAGSRFQIRLKSREFTPPAELDIETIKDLRQLGSPGDKVHFLMQFENLPNAVERERLEGQGISLIAYVTGNAYIASAFISKLGDLQNVSDIRWAGPLEQNDKTSESCKTGETSSCAQLPDGRAVLVIQPHADVSINEIEILIESLGGEITSSVPTVPSVTAVFPFCHDLVNQLSREDSVQYIDFAPPALEEQNDGARAAANVTPLAAAPFNLTGAGVTVLVYDSGVVDATHPDFGARVIEFDGDATETTRDHSTHVAGTVGGSGINSNGNDSVGNPNGGTANQWAGMAPGVNIRSFGSSGSADVLYDDAGDLNADFTTAITNGIDLATMSLGNNVVPNGFPCAQLGDYTNTAILLDNIVTGGIGGQQLIYFESAGNERTQNAPCGTFSTIGSPSTAKNTISVGAINSNDNSMTGFSSWGPTDDGRLKPDITGPGCQSNGDGNITSPSFIDLDPDGAGPLRRNGNLDAGETQNAYVGKCGTSMATPVAAGSTALLIEQWNSTRGTRPLPHTAKAILVHTATDLGNAGPDYQFGWGALDAQTAVNLVISDDTSNLIHVDQVDVGDTDIYTFNSDGSANVQVTLAWDDPAATRLSATQLINDLDLRLNDPDGVIYQPFVLNPAIPANIATTGNDTLNNVEMVIGAAKAGTWMVSVAGTTVPQGPQQHTLITPEDAVINQRPICDANGPYTGECTVSLDGTGSSDPDGDVLSFSWTTDCPGGSFDDANSPMPVLTVSSHCNVNCNVTLTVTDTKGASSSCSTTVAIDDITDPVITCPSDVTIECDEPDDPSNTGEATATDNCDPDPSITFDDVVTPGDCPQEKTIARTWTATDACGNTGSCTQTITVEDTTPPVINSLTASPNSLWPPNHKLIPVALTVSVTDNCDPAPTCNILSVSSNEAINGLGDGNTAPDWVVTGDLSLNLRAERSGKGSGRVYTITVECTDACGNSSTENVDVTVPHNKGKKK